MNIKIIAIIVLVVVGVGGLLAVDLNPTNTVDAKASLSGEFDVASNAPLPSLDEYARASKNARESLYDDDSRLQKITFLALKSSDTRLVSLSGTEAAWLDKHHYPTQQEIDNSKKKNSMELKDLALSNKDPKSLALYAGRLADEGNKVAAMSVYNQAASAGSIYALEESALLQFEVAEERFGTNLDSKNILAANLEVASILGDHRASSLYSSYLEGYDVSQNSETVRLQTSEFLRQLGSQAQSGKSSVPGPDPRPNQDIWSDIDRAKSGSDSITVYAR